MTDAKNRGRFVAGAPSPNTQGRPRRSRKKLKTPSDFRQLILKVANMCVESKWRGESRLITLYEANALALGNGSVPSRLAAKNFLDMVYFAAAIEEQRGKVASSEAS